ncbi:MAG: hypothetical protein LBL66_02865 [Clostridiales bacterium]|jgi:hypothetical protein|nr:hypothetical protein [Clostridiales bacterium]
MNKTLQKLIDFDALFAAYLNEWYKKKRAGGADYASIEEAAGGVYAEWADIPLPEAGGLSARQYFENIRDPKELVSTLIKYTAADISPPDLLAERIARDPECGWYLFEIARMGDSVELAVFAVNILSENGYSGLTDLLLGYLSGEKGGELADLAVEKLTESVGEAAPALLARLGAGGLSETAEKNIADVLVYANKDERIFRLLLRLFKEDEDAALYASYLGKYGDGRALPALLEYGGRQDINYMQFIETRNAVETLGGTLENGKDFTGDPYYKALKGTE